MESIFMRALRRQQQNQLEAHALAVAFQPGRLLYRVYGSEGRCKAQGSVAVAGERHILETANLISEIRMEYHDLRCIQLGLPGSVSGGRLVYASKPYYLVGRSVAAELYEYCSLPVFLCNDVNAMAYGFYHTHIEASLENRSLAYLYESANGPGAGFVVNGRLVAGETGFAGEIGNIAPEGGEEGALKSRLAAVISVMNPGFLVIGGDDGIAVDREEVMAFLKARFPGQMPRLHFSRQFPVVGRRTNQNESDEHYMEGLKLLALEKLAEKQTSRPA